MPDEEQPKPEATDPAAAVNAVVAAVGSGRWRDTTLKLPLGTVLILVSALLGAGGNETVRSFFGTEQEVLDRITAVEAKIAEVELGQIESKKVIDDTFAIVNSAHPPRGRVGIPDPPD